MPQRDGFPRIGTQGSTRGHGRCQMEARPAGGLPRGSRLLRRQMVAFGLRLSTNVVVLRTSAAASACHAACSGLRTAAQPRARYSTARAAGPGPVQPAQPRLPWEGDGEMAEGETIALLPEDGGRMPMDWARDKGLLNVELFDKWAPFIFSESDRPDSEEKPNRYRRAFIALANDWASPDDIFLDSPEANYAVLMAAGLPGTQDVAQSPQGKRILAEARRAVHLQREPNFLEAYGIPPSFSVLLKRIEEDQSRTCYANA